MVSAGGSHSSQSSSTMAGTESPVTAILQQLFGGKVHAAGGQFQPTAFGAGNGGVFTAQDFSALPGLLQNRPATGVEQFLTSPQFQALGLTAAGQSQDVLNQGAATLPTLLQTDPTAQIAAAQRGFTQDTLPAILERAPGFSSSDLQRELSRAGVDLQTNIAAMKEANLGRVQGLVQSLPQYAQALGGNLADQASSLLGLGSLGREFLTDVSPAGDAFRVLTALQSLTTPALTSSTKASGFSKGGNAGILS